VKKILSQEFVIGGKTYNSLDEIPADIRESYRQLLESLEADNDGDGIRDIMQGKEVIRVIPTGMQQITTEEKSFSVNVRPARKKTAASNKPVYLEKSMIAPAKDGVRLILFAGAILVLIVCFAFWLR
jgi:hypothetical protein